MRWIRLGVGFWIACLSARLEAGRPLVIDDAGTVPRGIWQVEAGVSIARDAGSTRWDAPLTLARGLTDRLEVGVGCGAALLDHEGTHCSVSDLVLAAKWQPLPADLTPFGLAVAPVVKLPTASDDEGIGTGRLDAGLTVIGTWQLEHVAVDVNLGWISVGETDDSGRDEHWHYGMAMRVPLGDRLTLVGEIFATSFSGSRDATPVVGQIGFQWSLSDSITLDAAIGGSLHEGPELLATAGLTWLF